jgi:hypothetical protein
MDEMRLVFWRLFSTFIFDLAEIAGYRSNEIHSGSNA